MPETPNEYSTDADVTKSRFADSLGGDEYDDLLLALDFYQEFQNESGHALQGYIAEHCSNRSEVRVLEAGPGTGITTEQILHADPRVHVVTVDIEPKMLDVVKKKFMAVEDYQHRAEFVLADILTFLESCPDESFDAFVSVYTLHNFSPDFRRQVLEVLAKKLKHGGIFINGDKYAREGAEHQHDLAAELKNYEKFDLEATKSETTGNTDRAKHLRQIHQDWDKHLWEDEKNKITVDEQNELFEKLGFENIAWLQRFDLVTTATAIKKMTLLP